MRTLRLGQIGLFAGCLLVTGSGAGYAQDGWRGWGPQMMMGPGMMGSGGFAVLCTPRGAGLAEWQSDRIERAVKPDEEQKKKLVELRTASNKAAETVRASCVRELPRTSPERLGVMEKRMEGMLQAIKTVRPAFEDFYNTLSPDQRTQFDRIGPRRWGWRLWRSES